MIPGEILVAEDELVLNEGSATITVKVANSGEGGFALSFF
jgi:urease beta subunit